VLSRQEGGYIAALAPAHAADAAAVDQALFHQLIDAGDHIPRLAYAEVAHVQLKERLTVAGALSVVRLQHERAAREGEIDWIGGGAAVRLRSRGARRPAVNHHEEGIAASGLEVDGLVQHALDFRAVLALPPDDFARVLRPRRDLRSRVAQLPGRVECG